MKVTNQTGTWVPLYVMTSEINDSMTREFFEEHDYFGYNKDYVKFFVQEMVPAVDFDGNLLMKSEDSLAMSPNGNGGWFKSLINAGLDKDLKDKGVEWLNVFAVDNVLQQIADPVFVGATICKVFRAVSLSHLYPIPTSHIHVMLSFSTTSFIISVLESPIIIVFRITASAGSLSSEYTTFP